MYYEVFSLKNHLRINSGEKLYQCAECDICFTIFGHLKRHMTVRNVINFSNVRSFLLESHMKIHTDTSTSEKDFQCIEIECN